MALEPAAPAGTDLLVRGAALPDWAASDGERIAPGRRVDVQITGGRITAVGAALGPGGDGAVLDVPGAVVLPGLHDHHLHLRSLVAAGRSVWVGPEHVAGPDAFAAALRGAPVDGHGWRRAVGYHESVAGDLSRWTLDAALGDGPLRVQHRSGVLWVVNSAGVDALDLDALHHAGVDRDGQGRPTGRLTRMDGWLAQRLPGEDPLDAVASVSAVLAARGVTGVTDATPDATPAGTAALVDAVTDGRVRQRLHVMCPAALEPALGPTVTRGPHKVVLDDDRLPALADLAEQMRAAHRAGVPVAVHCVTPAQVALTVAALDDAGAEPGDRIEHGSVIHPPWATRLARLGVTVVTNPGLVEARGDDYLDQVDERDARYLYPCASLLAAGVPVAAGTDAPFGPLDPWVAVRAARTRRTRRGRTLGAGEAVPLVVAAGLFMGRAARPGTVRRVAPGEPGDLCLLAGGAVPGPGRPDAVAATVVAGRVVHRTG